MKDILEKRVQELLAEQQNCVAQYNALLGRLEEAKHLLAQWYKEQCEKESELKQEDILENADAIEEVEE